ncbi:MAG: molybdenum cofactor sulfurase [Phyllobacteriaceae bacterium]|nr:molybdenum cofactor sulfurase [Phyllobacteriaceae bacterium]MBA91830.1 molybdenum cofactor sulfurase [Phyllobacteriaceae bacterium]
MTDPSFPEIHGMEVVPGRRIRAAVQSVLIADGGDFETRPASRIVLNWGGAEGDHHNGQTRRSGGREPWYERGTEMRNERQITIVSPAELAVVAQRMGLGAIEPGWIGANIVLDGIPNLSMLPRGTLVFFDGGATLKIDDQNGPCRIAGRRVAERAGMADVAEASLLFPKAAKRLRGLTAWVEKPGTIETGTAAMVMVPEQWIWRD